MAIVTERQNTKPMTQDAKNKLAVNNNKDLEVEVKKEEPSFFGSFFSAGKAQTKKKGVQAMEAVRHFSFGPIAVLTSYHSHRP